MFYSHTVCFTVLPPQSAGLMQSDIISQPQGTQQHLHHSLWDLHAVYSATHKPTPPLPKPHTASNYFVAFQPPFYILNCTFAISCVHSFFVTQIQRAALQHFSSASPGHRCSAGCYSLKCTKLQEVREEFCHTCLEADLLAKMDFRS